MKDFMIEVETEAVHLNGQWIESHEKLAVRPDDVKAIKMELWKIAEPNKGVYNITKTVFTCSLGTFRTTKTYDEFLNLMRGEENDT